MNACQCFSHVYFPHMCPAYMFLCYSFSHLGLLLQQLTKTAEGYFPLLCGLINSPHEYTSKLAQGLVIHLVKMSHVTCCYA